MDFEVWMLKGKQAVTTTDKEEYLAWENSKHGPVVIAQVDHKDYAIITGFEGGMQVGFGLPFKTLLFVELSACAKAAAPTPLRASRRAAIAFAS